MIATSWSPNEEHFLIVQGDGKLVYYNTLFDMMSSVNLDDDDETFAPGQEVNEENSKISHAQVTWKGDSRVFSINYTINGGVKCLTRDVDMNIIKGPARADKENVTDKNVFSVSEKPIPNMRLPIAMMPSGSLIAGFQVVPQIDAPAKNQIIFWEKNGLRHGEIDLPLFSGSLPEVKKLEFNSDSTFLAAHITFQNAEPPIKDQIIILHRSNYHWFIKKSLYAPSTSPLLTFKWLKSKKTQLVLFSTTSDFSFYDFTFSYHTSSSIPLSFSNLSYTANIDFTTLKLTPFKTQHL